MKTHTGTKNVLVRRLGAAVAGVFRDSLREGSRGWDSRALTVTWEGMSGRHS